MLTPRDPAEVIDAILVHIPQEHTALRKELGDIRNDSLYRPPDDKQITWQKLRDTLNLYLFTPPALDWEKQIHKIIKGSAQTRGHEFEY